LDVADRDPPKQATIDCAYVGFFLPYNQRGGYDAGNVNDDATRSLWLSARPRSTRRGLT
jgi:hypothetical protein